MLRARTIRHSASAYFQRDYSRSPKLELPHIASWSSELEEKRVRIQRPPQPHASSSFSQTLSGAPRRTRRSLAVVVFLFLGCASLWIFRNAYLDMTTSILDILPFAPFIRAAPEGTARVGNKGVPKTKFHSSTITHTGEPLRDTRMLRWPPMVTKIPETRPDLSVPYSGLTPSSVDSQFCNGAHPCRILLPLWIGEQESRGRMHLSQVLQLARALNRTLVLPNVGRSRIGACGKWEFDVYYDVGSFVGRGARVPEDERTKVRKVMLMDDFKTWLEMRPAGPEGQMVFVDEAHRNEDGRYSKWSGATLLEGSGLLDVHIDREPLDPDDPRLKKIRCLGTKFRQLRLDRYTPVTIHMPFPEHQKPLPDGDLLVRSLSRASVSRAAYRPADTFSETEDEYLSLPPHLDVLVLHWDLRHFPFGPGTLESMTIGQTDSDLNYSPKIQALVQKLIDPYKAYLAVHWRMETVPPFMLPDCAEALVDSLATLVADPTLGKDIKTVWFASDFPWPVSSSVDGPAPQDVDLVLDDDLDQQQQSIALSARRSHTFRSVTREHVEAVEILKASFRRGGSMEGYKLTGVTEELDRMRREIEKEGKAYVLEEDDEEGALLEDPGVLGILDKLAAMRAALFVSGAKRCGRVSTFTRQITDFRGKVKESDQQRNVVEVFG